MKKFFLIVTASVFCVTSFAETVQQDSESIEASSIEMTCELSSDASAELMSPSESMGPLDRNSGHRTGLLSAGEGRGSQLGEINVCAEVSGRKNRGAESAS